MADGADLDRLIAMGKNRTYHHGNLREALVDAAEALLVADGIQQISLRKVAKKAGVSQAAPYHHFPNKEALLAEVSCRGFLQLSQRMSKANVPGDAVASLRAVGREYFDFALTHPHVYRLMFGDECVIEEHPPLQEAAGATFVHLVAMIQSGIDAGQFHGEAIPVAMSVWGSVHGMVALLHAGLHDKKAGELYEDPLSVLIRSTLDMIEAGLTKTPPESSTC